MLSGVIHAVERVTRFGTVEWWEVRCAAGVAHTDGSVGVRVGQWTYPTCLECASAACLHVNDGDDNAMCGSSSARMTADSEEADCAACQRIAAQ